MRKYRVIQWGTGQVGVGALRGIIQHPQLELIGVAVYSADKHGVDAGVLCGLPSTGIKATTNHQELMSLRADCVNYNGLGYAGESVVLEIESILLSGKNVACTTLLRTPGNTPCRFGDVEITARFDDAGKKGGATFFVSGFDPGFATNLLPLTISGWCQRIDSIHVAEIMDYSTYLNAQAIFEFCGFGAAIPKEPPAFAGSVWIPEVLELAAGLDLKLDDVRVVAEGMPLLRKKAVLGRELQPGTLGALRFEVQGLVRDRPILRIEHVTRIDPELAPQWPQPPGAGGYRIRVNGMLNFDVTLEFGVEGGDFMKAGCWATGMRLVNAIPAICAAKPGVISLADLPLITGAGFVNTL